MVIANTRENSQYWPKDTDTIKYMAADAIFLENLVHFCNRAFPDADFSELIIYQEEFHTHCIGYDLYDAADHTMFFVVELRQQDKKGDK